MKPDEVQAMYTQYAPRYTELWHTGGLWAAETRYHLETLGELVVPGTRWLDVACGSGYFLSQFPGVERAGLDITAAQLDEARKASPDAEFFQHDMRDDRPDWHGRWSLVTSTGQGWNYLDSVDEVEQAAENMARWTSSDGACFVQVVDILDLVDCQITYDFAGARAPYATFLTGAVATTVDGDHEHRNLVYPSLDQWVRWLARHFTKIEIIRWPHDPPYPVVRIPRRSLLATGKRQAGDTTPLELVEHPVPPLPPDVAAARQAAGEEHPVATSEGQAGAAADGGVEQVGAPASASRRPLPGRPLYDQPLSWLLRQLRPTDPSFWRSVGRRARRLVS